MACFIAPAGVAIITTVVQQAVKKKEEGGPQRRAPQAKGKWTQRLRRLNTMLWGGAVLLALEHVWHGELVPWPPFLTAMQTPGEAGPMLREIATYGLAMTAVIVALWGVMVGVAELRARTPHTSPTEPEAVDGE